MKSTTKTWFPTAPAGAARLTLFCFPHAGGDLTSFRDWRPGLGDQIDVVPAALPGRERRIAEPSFSSLARLADDLVQPTIDRAGRGAFALFGHSMGALVAFELAHRLAAAGRRPASLIVSGYVAPQLQSHAPALCELSDEDFLEAVGAQGGIPDGLLDNREFRDLLLGVLRSDFQACADYRCEARAPLDIPVLVLGGDSDPGVDPSELAPWRERTSAPTEIRIFKGGHFFVAEQSEDVFATVRSHVNTVLQAPDGPGANGAKKFPDFGTWLKGRSRGESV
jgi:surfactin synthase thioesterase subunit